MRLPRACGPLLLAVAVGWLWPLPATAQVLSTFDSFSSAQLDGALWAGYSHTVRFADLVQIGGGWNNQVENPSTRHPRFSTSNASSFRRIVGGQLQLQLDSLGGTHANPNVAPGHGRIGVSARTGSRHVVQTKVTPMAAEAPGCRATGESRARAQLVVDVSVTDQAYVDEGNVFATLSLDRSSFG